MVESTLINARKEIIANMLLQKNLKHLQKKTFRFFKFSVVLEDNISFKKMDKDECRDIPFKNFS